MQDIFQNLFSAINIILGINFLIILILFLMILSNRAKIKKLKDKYNRFMNGLSDRNIEQLIDECLISINDIKVKNKEIDNHINHIERNLLQCVQKVGVIRFNAFENVGSDLSFAIALLDSNDSGIVLSGIYSRESSATYAKPVVNGKSRYTLSAEEIQALDIAKKTHGERIYLEK